MINIIIILISISIMLFTKETRIINIGHLPSHTNGKTELLQQNGFNNIITILCEEWSNDKIKECLKESPNSLFLIGGAMMSGFPELMNDLLTYIKTECPTIDVAETTKGDFDEGVTFPPTTEQICKSGLNICMRKLNENK